MPKGKKRARNNEYAICTAKVGRSDEAKYKRCKEHVKKLRKAQQQAFPVIPGTRMPIGAASTKDHRVIVYGWPGGLVAGRQWIVGLAPLWAGIIGRLRYAENRQHRADAEQG